MSPQRRSYASSRVQQVDSRSASGLKTAVELDQATQSYLRWLISFRTNGHPVGNKLLHLKLPSDSLGSNGKTQVSFMRCIVCDNSHDNRDHSFCLPSF